MTGTFDQPFMTSVCDHYVLHSHHRNGNPNKSQWIITPPEEIALFENVFLVQMPSDGNLWGLRAEGGGVHNIGRSCTQVPPVRNLRIAKFVCNTAPRFWHGYPADYMLSPQDRPPVSVLQAWRQNGHIQKHEIAKIRGSKPCSLSA